MEKMNEWFNVFNQKIDRIGNDVVAIRTELTNLRVFNQQNEFNSEQSEREGEAPAALPMEGATRAPIIEQHQTDIRLCKLAIERVDDKVETLRKDSH